MSALVALEAVILVNPDPSPTKDDAVRTPETLTSPATVNFYVAFVVPIPTLSLLTSTKILLSVTRLAVCLVFPIYFTC